MNACGWDVGGCRSIGCGPSRDDRGGPQRVFGGGLGGCRFGSVVGFAGLVWLVIGRWRYGRLVRGVLGWSVSVGWLVVAEGGCVRIGSHGGGAMGLERRFGLGHLCRGGSLAALTSMGQPSPAAGHGRDEGMR